MDARKTFLLACLMLFSLGTAISVAEDIGQVMLAGQEDLVVGEVYKGEYVTQQGGDLFQWIKSKRGVVQALFFSSTNQHQSANALQIELLDPDYQDQRSIIVKIKDISFNTQNSSWTSKNHTVNFVRTWKTRSGDQISRSGVQVFVQLLNVASGDYEAIEIVLSLAGEGFDFSAHLSYNNQVFPTLGYSMFVSMAVAVQIYSAWRMLRGMDGNNPVLMTKVSLLTLCLCNIEDFSLTMTHIQYIMTSESGYLFFIFPSMAYIILFVIFDMKMLFLVWRTHNLRNLENPQVLRKKLTAFYIQFYLGLFGYLTLSYFFEMDEWMIILRNLVLIPQIIHNVKIGNNPGFSPYYIFGYLGMRLALPLYERGCPHNRFMLAPETLLFVGLLLIYALEVLLVYLQFKLGSRFFVPKRFLPNYYEYRTKIKQDDDNREYECGICLQNIFSSDPSLVMNESSIQEDLLVQTTVMCTPCQHKFHQECLKQWMDVKLECPTCRAILPPI